MSLLKIQNKIDILTELVRDMRVQDALIETVVIEARYDDAEKSLSSILRDAVEKQAIADREFDETRTPVWFVGNKIQSQFDCLHEVVMQKKALIDKMTAVLNKISTEKEAAHHEADAARRYRRLYRRGQTFIGAAVKRCSEKVENAGQDHHDRGSPPFGYSAGAAVAFFAAEEPTKKKARRVAIATVDVVDSEFINGPRC